MKVKTTLNISNKKKNALPSSKLLKPKTFKVSVKKSGEGNNQPLSKDKLKLLNENIDEIQSGDHLVKIQRKPSKTIKSEINLSIESPNKSSHSLSAKKVKNSKEYKTKKISTLFDFVASQKQTENQIGLGLESNDKSNPNDKHKIKKKKSEKNHTSKFVDKIQNKENETIIGLSQVRSSNISKAVTSQKKNKKENATDRDNSYNIQEESKTTLKNKQSDKVNDGPCKKTDTAVFNKCNLKANKVAAVTKGLLKLVTANSSSKPDMLDVGEPILLQVECIKIPICPTKQLRFKLPHPVIDETSDVLLITADLKGHKIFPDKAVEHYEELLAKLDIDFINKIMPLRMIKKEYSQFEMRKKLVDQFDVILADSRIIKSLPPILGKFALYNRKMPIPVNLRLAERKLKNHLRDATHKTQMTVKSDGHCAVVQVGHTKMKAKDLAANVVEVAKSLESLYPGGWRNIRSLVVKTGTSTSLPVYLSLLSPNEVRIPVEMSRRPQPVEGELSTMPGYNVLVTPDGNVVLKKIDEERRIDDSRDDEILVEAEKYLESSKTVRYDESSDEEKEEKEDSDDEGETITDAMEKQLMNKYEKKAKAKKNRKEEEEEDEEEEEEEEESEIVPVMGKKRKSQDSKKKGGPPAKKAQGPIQSKGKKTADKSSDAKKSASPGLKKPQTRGTRGGKKNKLSKDQRKALIKRKKAGKK